ncbi:hypothetical protein [Bacillus mycoides]|uniref:Uncharacterized protein n=1 Tax=Bacillus mycoides TaxID=1405 RepID=A0ABC9QV26_BACMY|nr:hypothetical protein [Bacillus mycoides]EJR29994.1 hypothetical protein III_05763 [Bacillus mycoides]
MTTNLLSLSLNTTHSMFSDGEVAIAIFKALYDQYKTSENYKDLAEDIANRVQKSLDLAFYNQQITKFQSAERLFKDFVNTIQGDDGLADELHVITSDLMGHLEQYNTVEAYAASIQANMIYILILKYKYEKNIILREHLVERGIEYATKINEKFAQINNVLTNSITECFRFPAGYRCYDKLTDRDIFQKAFDDSPVEHVLAECNFVRNPVWTSREEFREELNTKVKDSSKYFSDLENRLPH